MKSVVTASSNKVAEAVKVTENVFRARSFVVHLDAKHRPAAETATGDCDRNPVHHHGWRHSCLRGRIFRMKRG